MCICLLVSCRFSGKLEMDSAIHFFVHVELVRPPPISKHHHQNLSLKITENFLGLLGISESWPCPLNKPLTRNSSGLMLIQFVVKSFMIFSQMRYPHQTCSITLWPRLVYASKTTKTDQKFDFKANTGDTINVQPIISTITHGERVIEHVCCGHLI